MTADSIAVAINLPRKPHDLVSFFHTRGIRYVRIRWVDLCHHVAGRVLPVSYFLKLLEKDRAGITMAKATLGLGIVETAVDLGPVGEHIYVFDLSSVRACSYAPGHAVCYGFVQEQVPIPHPSGPSVEVPFCPRSVLSRLVRYAFDELGIKFLVGFESEFTLVKSTNPLVFVHESPWTTQFEINAGIEAQIMEEIADSIQADGIELLVYHKEGAPGQFEIVTGPMTPLEAADALVHTRQTIYNIARKHGVQATFAPRFSLDTCGTGAHMHVSVRSEREPSGTSAYDFLPPVESAFLSGLLDHLPSVLAFTLPLSVSYSRMMDGIWSGGTWVCWGVDNREAPVRLTKVNSPSRNFEIRSVDGTCHPHLAVAGVLASGILGVRDNRALTIQNCNMPRTAAQMTPAERAALGITRQLPLSIEEARKTLCADDAIKEMLGPELVETYMRANQILGKALGHRDGESDAQTVARLVDEF